MKRCLTYLAITSLLFIDIDVGLAADAGYHVIGEIPVGGAGGWDYASFDDNHHTLYLSHGSSIAAVDVIAKSAKAHWADADGAHVALPVQGGDFVLITHGHAAQVTLNDRKSGIVLARIATDPGPDAAVLEPTTGYVFVMANHSGIVDVVDLGKKAVIAKIVVHGAPEAGAVDRKGLVFTHLEDKNAIAVIDAHTLTLKATYDMEDCEEPSGIAYVPQRDLILSACRNGTARLSRATSGQEVVKLSIGQHPDFALVDARRQLGFIPCGDGTLTVIRLDSPTPEVASTVSTRAGARTAALDAQTGYLYLPIADLGPPPAAGARPAIIPDTFRVLIVGH